MPLLRLIADLAVRVPESYPFGEVQPVGDDSIESVIEAFRSAEPNERSQASQALNPRMQALLLNFASRAAVRAVRERSPGQVVNGLAALALENGMQDPRDSICIFPMLLRSAELLQMDAPRAFEKASEMVSDQLLRTEMRGFPLRTRANRDLRAFYITEKMTKEGFTYEQRPWDFGPAVRRARIANFLRRLRERLSW
jgi:hypothetical protein